MMLSLNALKTQIATAFLAIASLNAACGSDSKNASTQPTGSEVAFREGGITSGGQTKACNINLLVGRTYASDTLTISFFANNQAGYGVKGDDQRYVVAFAAHSVACTVILTDSFAPGLKNGKTFILSTDDLTKIYDS